MPTRSPPTLYRPGPSSRGVNLTWVHIFAGARVVGSDSAVSYGDGVYNAASMCGFMNECGDPNWRFAGHIHISRDVRPLTLSTFSMQDLSSIPRRDLPAAGGTDHPLRSRIPSYKTQVHLPRRVGLGLPVRACALRRGCHTPEGAGGDEGCLPHMRSPPHPFFFALPRRARPELTSAPPAPHSSAHPRGRAIQRDPDRREGHRSPRVLGLDLGSPA